MEVLDMHAWRTYVQALCRASVLDTMLATCEGQMSTSFGGAISDMTKPVSPQQQKRRGSLSRVSPQGRL
jgi:hypothetical protein